MKTLQIAFGMLAAALVPSFAQDGSLTQTFESGEDTSDWGDTWIGGSEVSGFLAPDFGGTTSGGGASDSQSFSRTFRDNTAGLDITSVYSMSMHVQVDSFDGPSGGHFEIVDGSFGSGNAANLGIATTGTTFRWQARDNSSGWQDLGISMELGTPYRVDITVNPATFTYSTTVSLVDGGGAVQNSAGLSGLAFDQNVIGNHQNGNLLFYIQASSGGADVRVDNINLTGVPEPGSGALLLGGAAFVLGSTRRRPPLTSP